MLIAGPALAQLFRPKTQLYRTSVCKGEEVFSICFLIDFFFFQGEIVLGVLQYPNWNLFPSHLPPGQQERTEPWFWHILTGEVIPKHVVTILL